MVPMRRVGLIGGTRWVSTGEYYRELNERINARLGGADYARLTLDSLNFGDLRRNRDAGMPSANEAVVVAAARRLAAADAEAIVICANTPHIFAPAVEAATGLPVIHIAAATVAAVVDAGHESIGLIGTRITMESDLYRAVLDRRGIRCIVPNEADREMIDRSIFGELGRNVFTDEMRANYLQVIDRLKVAGAQGVILGCTEIPVLLGDVPVSLPTFDTTKIHCAAVVDFMLSVSNSPIAAARAKEPASASVG